MTRKTLSLLFILFLAPGLIFAQATQTGSINGTVRTPDGVPLPSVLVILKSPALVIPELDTATNESGRFRFPSLEPGIYELSFSLQGLEKVVRKDIQVSFGKVVTLDIEMSLQAASESIVVEGRAPTIDRQKTVGVTTMDIQFLQSVPAARNMANYFNMAPGVTGSSSHGSSVNENSYNLDGVNLGDPTTGTQLVSFGLDVMEEMAIMSSGLSAEYGSVKGSVINVITKSGGNQFSGQASFYLNHEKLQADNTKGTGVTGTSGKEYEYEPVLTLGGPIIRDKLWFFTNLSVWQSSQYYNGYPADHPDTPTPVKEFQPYPYLKLTYFPKPSDKFVLSYNFSDRSLDHRGANWDQTESATYKQRSPKHVFNFHWTHQFNSNLLANFKVGVVLGTLTWKNKDPNQAYNYDVATSIWSGSYFRAVDENIRNRYQINADVTAFNDDFAGSHELKIGGELQLGYVQWNVTHSRDPRTHLSYAINFPEYYKNYGIYNYGYYIFDFRRKENLANGALFVTDSWTPFKRLTLTLGGRLEYNATIWPKQMEEEGPQTFMGLPYNRSILKAVTPMKWVNVVPRTGAIFDLFGNGSTLLKASYGRYIQPNIVEWVNLGHPNGWFYYKQDYDWNYNLVGEPYAIQLPGGQKIGYPGYNDGKLAAPYMDEFTIGLERELFTDWSTGIRYIRKWDRNLIEDVDASQLDMDALTNRGEIVWTNWTPVTAVDPFNGQQITFWRWNNPGKPIDKYTINPPGATRDYDGLEFTLRKQNSHGWQFLLTYVYQKSRGLIATADSQSGGESNGMRGTSALYDDPNAHVNAVGRFPRERRHMLKFQGMVKGPWGINLSGYFSALSGRRYTRRISSAGLGLRLHTDVVVFAEPLGGHGYPALYNLDLRAEKEFRVNKIYLRLFTDVFNVFNDNAVTEVRTISNRTSYKFQDPRQLVPPRIFQLGAKIGF